MALTAVITTLGLLSLGAFGKYVAREPQISQHPLIGILAVFLGAFIVTLEGRITSLGLADIRGAVHAGYDEGAWITTANTVGQMLMCAPTVWLGVVLGVRRVLMASSCVQIVTSILLPFSPNLSFLLVVHFINGMALGTFLPLTVSFVTRNLPQHLVIYGIAAYAMNSELSQNISGSLEGFYLDHWSWAWIFWQNVALGILMLVCIYIGHPRRPVDRAAIKGVDHFGMLYYSVGFSLIYAALDQGNRLDWLNSGLISGLLLGGGIFLAAFVVQAMTVGEPWLDLRIILRSNMVLLVLMLIFLRFSLLATAYVIPQFLTTIQGYRALQVGDVLLLIALPQVFLAPIIGTILRFADPRTTMAIGFTLIGYPCFTVASGLTADWASDDFMPSQILQSIGQSFAFTSVVAYNTRQVNPQDALTFGTILQTARLMGGELGNAFMQTFVRVREQLHSNLLGLHVAAESPLTVDRLHAYAGAVAHRTAGASTADERAASLLANALQKQAYVLAYIDGFTVIGIGTVLCLIVILFLRPAPPARAPIRVASPEPRPS
jgi:DHA2 family multidrug resistance protein